jgi:hypothetical protein
MDNYVIEDSKGWKWDVRAEGKSSAYDLWKAAHPDRDMVLILSEPEAIQRSLDKGHE